MSLWLNLQPYLSFTHVIGPWEICMQVRKQQLELDMEQQTGSKQEKEYVNAVYCHRAYLTYMQSTSWETLGWNEAQAEIKIAGKNINNLRYADDTTLMAESDEELKSCLMWVKEEGENIGLKLKIQKTKIVASGPVTSWQIHGERMETVRDFIWGVVRGGLQNHCRWWVQTQN